MKQAVVFDLDGTLLNTLDDLCDSMNFALAALNFPARTLEEVRRFVGNGIRKLVERAVPSGTDAQKTQACYEVFCEHYKHNMANKTAEYSGVSDMLAALYDAGYQLAIVTNKADFAAQALCGSMFGRYVKTVVGSVEGRPNKPAPDGVFYALDKMGVRPEDAVFVGDSEVDIATAHNAGVDAIGVLWGFRDERQLCEAGVERLAHSPRELKKMLLDLKNCGM